MIDDNFALGSEKRQLICPATSACALRRPVLLPSYLQAVAATVAGAAVAGGG